MVCTCTMCRPGEAVGGSARRLWRCAWCVPVRCVVQVKLSVVQLVGCGGVFGVYLYDVLSR